MDGRIRKSIPSSWYRTTLPLPEGQDADAFIEQLAKHLSGRWREAWMWSAGNSGRHEIVLATPVPGDMAVLLAHVLVMGTGERKPDAASLTGGNGWVLDAPYERGIGLRRISSQLDRLLLGITRQS